LVILKMGSHELFLLGWPKNLDPPNLSPPIARITGVSHHAQLHLDPAVLRDEHRLPLG
jgi:hypothetical protein